ncbi:hypothetical protein GGTG_12451 [Gaeumannomyces tritici R3-111a-1]|uniref:Uncharacterized protein n=1 Tax=Gaeumannomyces tritici (strain R3-111a-1) TaxID=644352 RepID=J3PG25_GAET3|nr:hypothetical protein GGTG_12451 [Gaeumannomyces tritici R3-111a-1]EJT70278.1 hypothetical protein GGTG_12451 [Gaeumannomyces tritici R3-111a-1]
MLKALEKRGPSGGNRNGGNGNGGRGNGGSGVSNAGCGSRGNSGSSGSSNSGGDWSRNGNGGGGGESGGFRRLYRRLVCFGFIPSGAGKAGFPAGGRGAWGAQGAGCWNCWNPVRAAAAGGALLRAEGLIKRACATLKGAVGNGMLAGVVGFEEGCMLL